MNKFIKPTLTPKVKIDKTELKKKLSPLEYHITQEKGTETFTSFNQNFFLIMKNFSFAGTERPFSGKYLKLNDNGMYTCVVCNEELFSSDNQYDSGCGMIHRLRF